MQGGFLFSLNYPLITENHFFPESSQQSPDMALGLFGQDFVIKPLQATGLAYLV